MIEKINNSQIQDLLGKSSRQPDATLALTNNGVDASLHIDYASLIDQATQVAKTDTDAIRQAQELLQSGQLESPKNIREAAENIVRFGV